MTLAEHACNDLTAYAMSGAMFWHVSEFGVEFGVVFGLGLGLGLWPWLGFGLSFGWVSLGLG